MQPGKLLLTIALAVSPAFAQKKAAAARKAPAKAAAAAPVVAEPKIAEPVKPAEAPAMPAASSGSGLKFSALAWGGYNIPSSDEFSKVFSPGTYVTVGLLK